MTDVHTDDRIYLLNSGKKQGRYMLWKQYLRLPENERMKLVNNDAEGPTDYDQFFDWMLRNGTAYHEPWMLGTVPVTDIPVCKFCGARMDRRLTKSDQEEAMCDECYAGAGPPPVWMIERFTRELHNFAAPYKAYFDANGKLTRLGKMVLSCHAGLTEEGDYR